MVRTVESITGITIDFWMLTSFPGLTNLVNGIGGLTVKVPYPMHDSFSGANFHPGVQHLTGKQALAFSRDRHDVPGGDLGRSHDQGILFTAALAKLRQVFAATPGQIYNWIAVGWALLGSQAGGHVHDIAAVEDELQERQPTGDLAAQPHRQVDHRAGDDGDHAGDHAVAVKSPRREEEADADGERRLEDHRAGHVAEAQRVLAPADP